MSSQAILLKTTHTVDRHGLTGSGGRRFGHPGGGVIGVYCDMVLPAKPVTAPPAR